MSIEATKWAWGVQDITPVEKLILLALADHAGNEFGECWPGRQRLLNYTQVSAATLTRNIASLEKKGLLTREARYMDSTRKTNLYTLNLQSQGMLRVSRGYAQSEQGVCSQRAGEPSLEPSDEKISCSDDARIDHFAEFWQEYPRKIDKQRAQVKYDLVIRKKLSTHQALKSAARAYAEEVAGKDLTYVKHPATWLNSGSYENGQDVQGDCHDLDYKERLAQEYKRLRDKGMVLTPQQERVIWEYEGAQPHRR